MNIAIKSLNGVVMVLGDSLMVRITQLVYGMCKGKLIQG